jgi:hypothetical protein
MAGADAIKYFVHLGSESEYSKPTTGPISNSANEIPVGVMGFH